MLILNSDMTVLIFSDSHGSISEMLDVTSRVRADLIIHLGDFSRDAQLVASQTARPLISVSGNCDRDLDPCYRVITDIGGVMTYITHGNAFYADPALIAAEAKKCGCTLALFGHSHVPCDKSFDGVRVINPGSISRPRYPARYKSYAAGTFSNGKADIGIVELED